MVENRVIMGVETSALLCSIAWWADGKILLEYNIQQKNQHAQILAVLAEKGFQYLGIDPVNIGLVAVASGPGSFTGLRIGMAFVKGFCYALEKPLIAVSNFELMFASVETKKRPVIALIDAHRGNLYRAVLREDRPDKIAYDMVSWPHLTDKTSENTIIIKEERLVFPEAIQPILPVLNVRVTAADLCRCASIRYNQDTKQDLNLIEPFYLQKFAGME